MRVAGIGAVDPKTLPESIMCVKPRYTDRQISIIVQLGDEIVMRSKSLYLLVACICGSVAAVFASQWLNAQSGSGEGNKAEIFVASVDINVGDEITAERIKLEAWPTDKVPQGGSGDLTTLEDKYAKQRIYAGEPIVPVKLMDVNWNHVDLVSQEQ